MANTKKGFLSAKKYILDILFPISCHVCENEGAWLCRDCKQLLTAAKFQICPLCEKIPTTGGKLCGACRESGRSYLDALITSIEYETFPIKKLIFDMKYRFVPENAAHLAYFMVKALFSNECALPHCIVPVPLHERRLRWRGFNQSKLLAEFIAFWISPPLEILVKDILKRRKHAKPQMEIKKYQDRIGNVKGLFAIRSGINPDVVKGKKILLVDDVATTGATLQECARILKENGAKKVTAVVIARQTLKK